MASVPHEGSPCWAILKAVLVGKFVCFVEIYMKRLYGDSHSVNDIRTFFSAAFKFGYSAPPKKSQGEQLGERKAPLPEVE